MKRSALFFALLLAAAAPLAASPSYGTIVTQSGQVFYDCSIVKVHPDGLGFIHRDGAAKIAFRDLPQHMRREFRYDPAAEARHKREQAALRKQEKERQRLREVVMEEQLMEAQMAEASYLAAASTVYNPAPVVRPMSTALPGEPVQVVTYQPPSWVGPPIGSTYLGSRGYRRTSSWGGYNPYGFGYGYSGYYPSAGYTYPSYSYPAYNYPSYSYPTYNYPSYGRPYRRYGHGSGINAFGSWNVGNGVRVGVGVTPFGGGIRVFR